MQKEGGDTVMHYRQFINNCWKKKGYLSLERERESEKYKCDNDLKGGIVLTHRSILPEKGSWCLIQISYLSFL